MTIEDFRTAKPAKTNSTAETPSTRRMEIGEKDRLDQITRRIIGAAIEVHRHLGPGLLESAYETCLLFELKQLGFMVEQQKPVPVTYKGMVLDCGYRLDLVVENSVIVELKAVEQLAAIFEAQLLSYFRLTGKKVGLLINFHVPVLKNGIKRIVNDFPDDKAFSVSSASRR